MAGIFLCISSQIQAVERQELDKVEERISEIERKDPELARQMKEELTAAVDRGEIVVRDEKNISEDEIKAFEAEVVKEKQNALP